MYRVHEWARVHELARQGKNKTAISEELGMSRNTVDRLLALQAPPRYQRKGGPSLLDPFKGQIAAILDDDAKVKATVIIDRLRRDGYTGGITILKDYLQQIRPQFLAAKTYQRTTYLPGELSQFDWWSTGVKIPVGKGFTREAFGLVATLPHSAAHAVYYTFGRTTADLVPAFVGCLVRFGGSPEKAFFDNDPSVLSRTGGRAVFHPEVLALFGHFGIRGVALRPGNPEAKGQAERTIGYLETSFLPLRSFTCIEDLQNQSDRWNLETAQRRHHRRVGGLVADAFKVEQQFLRPLPNIHPNTDQHLEVRVSKDGFIRVAGSDYSVPPGLVGRRVQVRLSLKELLVFHEHREIARHRRSYIPTDVVLHPLHVRALRLAREAKARLERTEIEVEEPDLSRYDRLAEVSQ